MSEHSAASSVSSSTKVSDKVSDKGTPKMHAKFAVRFSVGRVYKEGRTMRDDCELLRQYSEAGSEEAFAELVHRHLPLVYSAALRQAHGDGTAAEDIAQTVFVDLARKAGSLSGRLRLASWLYTSTRFASAKVLRGEQRRRLRESAAAEMQEPACQSGTERAWVELSPVLDEAMSLLDPGERDVILLRFFEGRQLKEVGAALGLSEDAARMRVNRALETLRSVLASRGVTPSAAALATVLSCEGVKAAPAGLASSISGSALRGGAAGLGTVVGLARLLTASKLKVGILGTVLAVAVAIPVLSNRQTQPEPPQAVVAPAQGAERDKNGLPSPGTAVRVQEVAREMLPTRARPGRPPGAIPALPVIPSRPVAVAGPPMPVAGSAPQAPARAGLPLRRPTTDGLFDAARQRMVAEQLVARGIANQAVLQAMGRVPRHNFTIALELPYAYADRMLGLGYERPIETPYVVASVAERLEPKPADRVLEINTGFGYQTAVLSQLVQAVYTVESARQWAESDFQNSGYTNNILVRRGDFGQGWAEAAPFDSIVLNGSAEQITPSLIEQLKEGGRLIVPVGEDNNLHVYLKTGGRLVSLASWPVRPQPVPGNEVELPLVRRILPLEPK
jgi:protein-L-isoaspartate(D-aspartate) O-methyltransferase